MHEMVVGLIRSGGEVGPAEDRRIGDDANALRRPADPTTAMPIGLAKPGTAPDGDDLRPPMPVGSWVSCPTTAPSLSRLTLEVSAHDRKDQLAPLGAQKERLECLLAPHAEHPCQRLDGCRPGCVDAFALAPRARFEMPALERRGLAPRTSNHTWRSIAHGPPCFA